jgi:hypothetical protein
MRLCMARLLAVVALYSSGFCAVAYDPLVTAPGADAKKLMGPSIDQFNTLMAVQPADLRALVSLGRQMRNLWAQEAGLKQQGKRRPGVQVRDYTTAVVKSLERYFKNIWPGRELTKQILIASINAHNPAEMSTNYILQFLNQPDEKSMIEFFKKTITEHDHLIQISKQVSVFAEDIKASLSDAAKAAYRAQYPPTTIAK